VRPDRHAGYLGDVDWDHNWEPVVSSDDKESNKDADDDDKDADDDDKDDEAKDEDYEDETPPPPRVSGEVFGQIYNGRVIRDDTDDMIHHVVYHYFQAANRGEAYQMPPELTEEELAVTVLISEEEERRAEMRAFPELADALVLLVAPPPPPGPPPMQPPRTPSAMPRREARAEPWDAWPGAAPGWSAGAPPTLGWAPGTSTPPPTYQGLHRRPLPTGHGRRGPSTTSPAMMAMSRPCRRRYNPSLG
jgi:hypothetical protein